VALPAQPFTLQKYIKVYAIFLRRGKKDVEKLKKLEKATGACRASGFLAFRS
jgi:hypothetical protein